MENKKINLIFLCILTLIVLLFNACGKTVLKRVLHISVVDSIYKIPVENCKIYITQHNGREPLFFNDLRKTTELNGLTDKSGKTEFEFRPFKNKKASKIYIIALMNEFHGDPAVSLKIKELEWDEKDIKAGTNDILINSPPIGYILVNIKSLNPYNEDDIFAINFDETYLSFFKGSQINNTFLFPIFGNKIINIFCKSKKNNVENIWQYDVYCPANDTTNFDINY